MSEIMERQRDRAFAKFYFKAVENKAKSEEMGSPAYDDVPYVEITKPEDKHYKFVGIATADHKARFPLAWRHFEETAKSPVEGTPLNLVPIFTPGQIETLLAAGIRTLEKFAGLQPDDVPQDFRDLHRLAARYLDAANDKGALARKCARLEEKTEVLEADNENLRKELKLANDELKALKNPNKSGQKAA